MHGRPRGGTASRALGRKTRKPCIITKPPIGGFVKLTRPTLEQSAPKKPFQRRERVRRPASSCKKVPCLSWMRIAAALVKGGNGAGVSGRERYQRLERLSRSPNYNNIDRGMNVSRLISPDPAQSVKGRIFWLYPALFWPLASTPCAGVVGALPGATPTRQTACQGR